MIAGLTSAFFGTIQNGEGNDGERGMYADFLDEASQILKKPGLQDAASLFRDAGAGWERLGARCCRMRCPHSANGARCSSGARVCSATRAGRLARIARINARIKALKHEIAADFPLDEAGRARFFDALRESILRVRDLEVKAVQALQAGIIDR